MRNMSFALTTEQVRAQTKTVTRRMGWLKLKPGDLIQPVKKCMGLRPGEKIEKIGDPVRVVDVRREPLRNLTDDVDYGFVECALEGFPAPHHYHWPSEFVSMFCATHKGCTPDSIVTRIEFAYGVRVVVPYFHGPDNGPGDRGFGHRELTASEAAALGVALRPVHGGYPDGGVSDVLGPFWRSEAPSGAAPTGGGKNG
jgi:hypothetical protein